MAKTTPRKSAGKRAIQQYQHTDKKRVNIPPVGLVTPETDPLDELMPERPRGTYAYDPHLDPQLVWAGKAERDIRGFEVPTVSLHVHERIDPKTIIEAVRARNGNGNGTLPNGHPSPLPSRERELMPPSRAAAKRCANPNGAPNCSRPGFAPRAGRRSSSSASKRSPARAGSAPMQRPRKISPAAR